MIKKPSQEELEVHAAEDRLAQEQWAEIRKQELEAQEKLAKLKFSISLRHKAWLAVAKAPAHVTAMWLVFWLALFKRPVPAILEDFLRR